MRRFPALVAVTAVVLVAVRLRAASPEDFELRIVVAERTPVGGAIGGEGVDYKLRVLLSSRAAGVEGWSFGLVVEADPGLVGRIVSARVPRGVSAITGGALLAVNRLEFFTPDEPAVPACAWSPPQSSYNCPAFYGTVTGVTQTVHITADDVVTLNATEDFAVLELDLRVVTPVVPPPEEPAQLGVSVRFTDAFGDPATPSAVRHGGIGIAPAVQEGVSLGGFPPRCYSPMQFTIACGDGTTYAGGVVTSLVTLNFDADPATPHEENVELQGWCYGLCVDSAKLEVLATTTANTDTETCAWGHAPDYEVVDILPGGVTHSVVVEFKRRREGFWGITPRNGFRDLRVTYAALAGEEGEVSYVTPCSGVLGTPAVGLIPTIMVIWGESLNASSSPGIDPARECCVPSVCNKAAAISIAAFPPILGGNTNSDASLDIGDAVYLLQYLFRKGPAPGCMAAADFNADGKVDIGDPIAIVTYLFPEPGRLPQPWWHVGCYRFDAGATTLGCLAPPLDACGGQGR